MNECGKCPHRPEALGLGPSVAKGTAVESHLTWTLASALLTTPALQIIIFTTHQIQVWGGLFIALV